MYGIPERTDISRLMGFFFVLLSITYVRGHLRLRNFINIIIYLLFQSEDGDHTHSHPTSLNKSVYDSLRQGGSTSLIESLQSQVPIEKITYGAI